MQDWLIQAARRAPGAPALRTAAGIATYAELAEGARATAGRLAARGVRRGDRVATTLPPGRAFAELLHAMPLLGTTLVPLNTRLSEAELEGQVADAAPALVVDAPLDGPVAEIPAEPPAQADDPFTLLFTSGSTARPKPVVLTYANHAASADASAANLPLTEDDRWLCPLPLFHVGGLAILLRCARAGACAVVHEGFDVEAVRRALEAGEATVVSLVPTMLRRLADAGLRSAPRLRAVLLGGGPIPRDLLEWAGERGIPVLPTYGMTETASQVVTAGHPLPGVELRIAGDGEILVRGPMVSPGARAGDGWLHTGDRGRLGADGRLHVEGRLKEVVVTGGENVSMVEVEEALLAHPAVADAGVVGRPDPEWGEVVVAHVVLREEVADAELAAHCRERLAGYKVPKAFVRHDELPRNAAGKLLRGRLP